jgi:hypothetical protein
MCDGDAIRQVDPVIVREPTVLTDILRNILRDPARPVTRRPCGRIPRTSAQMSGQEVLLSITGGLLAFLMVAGGSVAYQAYMN